MSNRRNRPAARTRYSQTHQRYYHPAPSTLLSGNSANATLRSRSPAPATGYSRLDSRQSSRGEVPGKWILEAGAILRIGRKVLIDHQRFFDWVRQQNGERK